MNVSERREAILAQLARSEAPVRTATIRAALSGVSPQQVNNDLSDLVERGEVLRIGHGLYTTQNPMNLGTADIPLFSSLYATRASHDVVKKSAIAKYLCRMAFRSDGAYALDAGSTITAVFYELTVNRPPWSITVTTNNIHGALLVPPESEIDLELVGGKLSYQYAATCGEIAEAAAARLDVSIVGFSRLVAADGVWSKDTPQWAWKRRICRARRVFFPGTLDKLGHAFHGKPFHSLKGLDFTVVSDCDATALSDDEVRRVAGQRKALKDRLILVDEDGNEVEELKR